jgi:O-antigen ligase
MARKRRPAQDLARTPAAAAPAAASWPREPVHGGSTAALLALMMFVAPAIGSPTELMLQDTLKSIVVSLMALSAALLLFLQLRGRREPLRWHGIVWLPLLLCAYALGSMVWSHPYLGGVEAVRWFVFAVIAWLGLNTLTRPRLSWLAWGVHGGALVAAIWAAAQFWVGFGLFPQGPNPGSTFINRNFFAEFVVCTLPFGMLLLARARVSSQVLLLAVSNGFIVTTILMTGTRAALMALWLQLLLVWPLVAWRCRGQLAWPQWSRLLRLGALTTMLGTVVLLGILPSNNPKILDEERGGNALQRGMSRTQSIGPKDYSLGVRMVMWRATLNAIKAKPLTGLGAGAWESEIPLYQAEGSQLETDYYVHNEFLQMVSEYGLAGWAFLLSLLAYLAHAAWRSWRHDTPEAREDQPWRAVLLASLLALMVVSNIGFPWRMATTGALFALCLGGLAASDARLGWRPWAGVRPLRWSARIANACVAATVACLALAVYISQQAAEAESKLVQAAKLALTMTASGRGNAPEMEGTRREILKLVREGIAINPHYRKITPMVADELARWGDWRDATWIWESVLSSRPYVVAIIANAARGHASLGEMDKALADLDRAKKIQPRAPAVRSLEVIMLARSGQEAKAYAMAKEAMDAGLYDYDLVNALYVLAVRAKDFPVAEKALKLRMTDWPENKARSLFQLGMLYAGEMKKPAEAVETLRQAMALGTEAERAEMLAQVPAEIRAQLAAGVPAAAPQTSARSK